MLNSGPAPIFHEEQRVTQRWLWIVIYATAALLVGVFVIGMYTQLVVGRPFGDNPISDTALWWAGSFMILLGAFLPWLVRQITLITEIRVDGLYVRHRPFHLSHRKFEFENIASCEARDYSGLREYGGWGIRWSSRGMCYTLSGTRGVQLTFKTGKRLLIGSRKAEELASAVKRAMEGLDWQRKVSENA